MEAQQRTRSRQLAPRKLHSSRRLSRQRAASSLRQAASGAQQQPRAALQLLFFKSCRHDDCSIGLADMFANRCKKKRARKHETSETLVVSDRIDTSKAETSKPKEEERTKKQERNPKRSHNSKKKKKRAVFVAFISKLKNTVLAFRVDKFGFTYGV